MAEDDFHKLPTLPGYKVATKDAPADITTVPDRIGPYPVEGHLDKGGMSQLFLGTDPQTHNPLVIKVLSPKFVSHPEAKGQFLKEAELISLADHPAIVKLYGQGEWEGGLYLAMEFIQGISLRQFILHHTMSLGRAIDTILQVAGALLHLHSHRIIHRDVKPENILITAQGGVKVIDFGIAALHPEMQGKVEPATHKVVGTPVYMSPEQKQDPSKVSYQSDIYSLGILLYELVLGRLSHGNIQIPLMPKGLQKILAKALQPKPEDRYSDIAFMIADLSKYLRSPAIEKDAEGRGYSQDLAEHLRATQDSLLPEFKPSWSQVDIGLATHRQLSISAVYYDFLDLGHGKYQITISEPSAKGAEGIVHMAMLEGMIHALSDELTDPVELVTRINKLICKHPMDEIVTLNMLLLDGPNRSLTYLSSGYGPLWLARPGHADPELIVSKNIALGIDESATFVATTQNWNIGDTVILTTLRAGGGSEKEVRDVLKDVAMLGPQQQADALLRKVVTRNQTVVAERPAIAIVAQRTI